MRSRTEAPRRVIAWEKIRSQIEAAGRVVEGAAMPSAEVSRTLLEQRARTLSRPIAPDEGGEALHLVSFRVHDELYAAESRRVFEVCRACEFAPFPSGEHGLFGMAAWRGDLLPVLDLRTLLGARHQASSDIPALIVIGGDRPSLCLRADASGEVLVLPASGLRIAPEGLAGREYLRGMVYDAVLVLDVGRILHAAGAERA